MRATGGAAAAAVLALVLALPAAGEVPAAARPEPAEVTVGARVVATFRAELFARPPVTRAREAQRTLDEIVREGGLGEVHQRIEGDVRLFLVGSRMVFALVPADLDPEAGETIDAVAESVSKSLAQGLSEVRERHDGRRLAAEVASSLVATALFLLFVGLLRFARRLLEGRLVALTERLAGRLAVGGKGFVPLLWLTQAATWTVRVAVAVAGFFAVYLWLAWVLRCFPWTRPWGEELGRFLASTARAIGKGALRQLPDLFLVVVIALLTQLLVKLSGAFFDAIEEGRIKVSPALAETTKPTRRIVTAILWIFALIMAYPYLPGSGTEAFKGVSVVLGVMVSLGSTTIVGQVFSGFMLLYARVFKVGDFVRIGDVEGIVEVQGLFTTKITTPWNDEMSIPNAVVAGAVLRNHSRSKSPGGPLLSTRVTIGYDAPWRQVEGLLLLASERTGGLKQDPAPFVRHWSLSDFYVEYELNAAIERPGDRIAVLSALHANVQDAFNEHGVQIMSPHYLGDPASPKVVPPGRWSPPPARRPGA
ncbi:MAG: mechanosensitive ion channel [Thermoanaerobaculia bacterium]